MILTASILTAALLTWLALAAGLRMRHGISFRQALLFAPLRLIYRVDAGELRKIEDQPGTVYVISHQSRLDPAIMMSLLADDTLHILDHDSASVLWLEPWREATRTIAFNPGHVFFSRRLVRLLKGGGRLAVYLSPETEPDPESFRLYRAVARIAARSDARIVPVHIGGASMLPFSLLPREQGPRRLFPKLRIGALAPATIAELAERSGFRQTRPSNVLFDRMAEARMSVDDTDLTIFRALKGAAERFGMARPILSDEFGAQLSYRRLLLAVRVLARRFTAIGKPGDAVGLFLPNAAAAATAFFALQSSGRVAAMLNYTSGPANLAAAIRTGRIGTVISSRAFVDKARIAEEVAAMEAVGARFIWLEELRESVTSMEKAAAFAGHRRAVAPPARSDAPAVILFTSGSESEPKGVLLSHRNLLANVAQVGTRIDFSPADLLFNVLPVFHSFGMTGGMILPLLRGVRLHLYPSPLHYKAIPQAVAKVRPTVLFGTDTFLVAYARAASDGEFASLRLVVAGAEPVRRETRRMWRERFGVEIMEGFGMTETSPVVAVNSATHARDGSVGRLLPGMRARLEPVEGIETGGRLLLSGPNVMLGYIDPETDGKPIAPQDGWHDSGDIVSVDNEGFIFIRGRARRFAKIAGEMVSLGAVEMMAQELWPDDKHAAVAVPDARKGERVVLITSAQAAGRDAFRAYSRANGAPDLLIPAEFVVVDDIPVLGTGKTDYARVNALARASLGLGEAA